MIPCVFQYDGVPKELSESSGQNGAFMSPNGVEKIARGHWCLILVHFGVRFYQSDMFRNKKLLYAYKNKICK